MNGEFERILERYGRGLIEVLSRHVPGETKSTKNLSQKSRCPGWNSNRILPNMGLYSHCYAIQVVIYMVRLSSLLTISSIWASRELGFTLAWYGRKLNQSEDFRLHQVCPAFRSAGNTDTIWCDVGNMKFNALKIVDCRIIYNICSYLHIFYTLIIQRK
jgi:hypothetical protein